MTREADNALRANIITTAYFADAWWGTSAGQSIGLSPSEEADLDQAIIDTYARGNRFRSANASTASNPATFMMLVRLMDGSGPSLSSAFINIPPGTFAGIFSQQSNIDINNSMVTNIRDEMNFAQLRRILCFHTFGILCVRTKTYADRYWAWQLMRNTS